jgi:hypothetical protein
MRQLFLLLFWLPVHALAAPTVVTSSSPDKVSVTLYRDPDRGLDTAIDHTNPSAFALITETRSIDLPPGEVTVRFEGVSGGIVPQSAILFGTSPRERNRDAALLSQKGLVDGFTGQSVILKRTDRATGAVTEERATIRSAADRLILTTPRGVEAVYCSGLAQTLIYPGVPAGLSAKPVLSMTTKDQPGGRVTVTLAYIATGFDWEANYVGTLSDDGKSMQLLSWLTMASGDDTSFVDATTAAVAGKINRLPDTRDDTGIRLRNEAAALAKTSRCWPAGTTTDGLNPPPPLLPPMAAPMSMALERDEIMVTARRAEAKAMDVPIAVKAVQEALGDLKLYRIPVPVTVAAHSQKQVAFLSKEKINGTLIYRSRIGSEDDEPDNLELLFRFRNRKQDGLGEPLPAGQGAFFQQGAAGRMLIGQSSIADKAVDEDVDFVLHEANDVTLQTDMQNVGDGPRRTHRVTLRNANPYPVRVEIEFPVAGANAFSGLPGNLVSKPGKLVWVAILPASGSRTLEYSSLEKDRS